MTQRIFVHVRSSLLLALLATSFGVQTGVARAQDENCETCCEEDCGRARCNLGYSIARHLKLQSVYAFRKICRPYRRMAGTPEQLAPWVEPVVPFNTDPFAGGVSAGSPGGYGMPGYAPSAPMGQGGWAATPGYDSFGGSYQYSPTGPAIRYNSAP